MSQLNECEEFVRECPGGLLDRPFHASSSLTQRRPCLSDATQELGVMIEAADDDGGGWVPHHYCPVIATAYHRK